MAQFTNRAQLSYNDTVVNSNVAVGEILEVISASKTAISSTYGRDDNITYIISLVNSGTTTFSGISITDDLGGYESDGDTFYPLNYVEGSARIFVNGQLQPAPSVIAGPPLVFSGITIPASSNVIIIYETEVTGYAPLGIEDTIVNTATISGGGLVTPITVTETVSTEISPLLTITKIIDPVPVADNGRLTYTFIIQNSGNIGATDDDNVAVRDLFDPILSDITVTLDGTVLVEGADYNYEESTGLFTTVPGRITVPSATYTRDPDSGVWVIDPGVTTLIIRGTI